MRLWGIQDGLSNSCSRPLKRLRWRVEIGRVGTESQPTDDALARRSTVGHRGWTEIGGRRRSSGLIRFTAIGYNVVSHHVKFEVWADAKRLYESPQAGIVPIDVKLPSGTKTIELKINDLGNRAADQSMWCYPRLHRK